MSRKEIIVEIDADGNCSVEGKGFKGPECEKFMQEVCDALGKTTSQRDTHEHSQRDRSRVNNQQRNRR